MSVCVCTHYQLDHTWKGCTKCACEGFVASDLPDFGTDATMWHAWAKGLYANMFKAAHEAVKQNFKRWNETVSVAREVAAIVAGQPEVGTIGVGVTGPARDLSIQAQIYAKERSTEALQALERVAVEYASKFARSTVYANVQAALDRLKNERAQTGRILDKARREDRIALMARIIELEDRVEELEAQSSSQRVAQQ